MANVKTKDIGLVKEIQKILSDDADFYVFGLRKIFKKYVSQSLRRKFRLLPMSERRSGSDIEMEAIRAK